MMDPIYYFLDGQGDTYYMSTSEKSCKNKHQIQFGGFLIQPFKNFPSSHFPLPHTLN